MTAWWKCGLILAYTVAAFAAGWRVEGWKDGMAARIEEAQQAETIDAENSVLKEEHSDQLATDEVSHAYEARITVLDHLYDAALAGVRPDPDPAGAGLPAVPQGKPGHHAAPDAGRLPRRTREALIALAKQADLQAARLSACQTWIKSHGG